uniref:Protein TBATA n=1 Tax=Geotrypetes seraphini TaxID=260995 RepID=A0A6P8QPY9_GEOSA|nr:protein TBATA [Geotrypetes seraphini]XP_033799185.1 protein TBATA [Geotrypetes seraphini]
MATETAVNSNELALQKLKLKDEHTCFKEQMENLKNPVSGPFKSKEIPFVAKNTETMTYNTPLRFAVETPRTRSKSSSRFGNLSHHSFFSRHNPHPHRVTHMQGLNGIPICIVNDELDFSSTLPPHPMMRSQLPINILGVPSTQMPIGDPHGNLIPHFKGASTLSEAWREELRELAVKVCATPPVEAEQMEVEEPRRTTRYSAETGRIIPPPTRALTRHASRKTHRNNARNKGINTNLLFQDQELVVLELLCQILQTDSLSAVQKWLLLARQREKDYVMGMIQTAVANMQFESHPVGKAVEERLYSQASQNSHRPFYRDQPLGKNMLNSKLHQRQKQEPIPEEEKPEHIGTAEVLQIHSTEDEKPEKPNSAMTPQPASN